MKGKRRTSTLMGRRNRIGYFYIFPLILGVLLIFIPNLVQTARFSVSQIQIGDSGYTLDYKGFTNYITAFTKDPFFVRYALTSLGTLATSVPVLVIFSLFIATLLNQKFRGRLLARAIFFVPVILSTGIISAVETLDGGNLDFLAAVGSGRLQTGTTGTVQGLQIDSLLLSMDFSPTLISIVTGAVSGIYSIVQQSGMQIFILLAALQEIPTPLYEAARVEGCNSWEVFWKITFPMIGPQLAVCVVYTIIDSYSRSDGSLFAYLNSLAFGQNQYELATAMYLAYLACLAVFIGLVFFLLSKMVRRTD